MDASKSALYSESEQAGNAYRERQITEWEALIDHMRCESEERRRLFFQPNTSSIEAYEQGIEPYRAKFREMLGWPLAMPDRSTGERTGAGRPAAVISGGDAVPPKAEITFVAEDELSTIYRVEIDAGYSLTTYGLLFLPKGGASSAPYPLVISQHGGSGTPELCSGFYGETNYRDMSRLLLRRGVAVFAPQLLLWQSPRFGPDNKRLVIDKQLKQLGSSVTAVEIYKIQRSLDYLLAREDIDSARVGMLGLSYGGFYTLFTTAVETRIKAAYSSCFINDRFVYDWPDFTWFNAGNTFLDAEVCGLICPRFLYLEAARSDEVFVIEPAVKEMDKVARLYEQLNIADRLSCDVFEGVHELNPSDDGIELFCRYLKNLPNEQ